MSFEPWSYPDARRFIAISAAALGEAPAKLLRELYVGLDYEAWLIEAARAQLRIAMRVPYPHRTWGTFLGLDGRDVAREYRALLCRPDPVRAALREVARVALEWVREAETRGEKLPNPPTLYLSRTSWFHRWTFARTRNLKDRPRRVGRPLEVLPTTGLFGKTLEQQRLRAQASAADWAALLGVSLTTYRAYLILESTPTSAAAEHLRDWGGAAPKLVEKVLLSTADYAAKLPRVEPLELDAALAGLTRAFYSWRDRCRAQQLGGRGELVVPPAAGRTADRFEADFTQREEELS